MTASEIVREPAVEDLRAEVARLVVAVTDSWPGERVFTDRRELAHVVEAAVRQVAEVKTERDRLAAEAAGLRAGEDSTPTETGVVLTAGQMWHRLLEAGHDERLRLLNILINQGQEAARCFEQDHTGQIEELKRRPTRQAFDEVCQSVELQRNAFWTARHQLAEALDHKGVTDASVTFEELVAHARDIRLTWLSDNGHLGLASDDAATLDLSPQAHALHAQWDADGAFRSVECARKGCPLCLGSPWVQRQMATEPDPAAEAPRG